MEAKTDRDGRPQQQQQQPPPPPPPSADDPVQFDPTRMIGIIKRRALIKQLASAYHAQCRASCQDLLQLQSKWDEFQHFEKTVAEEAPQPVRPAKRTKKGF